VELYTKFNEAEDDDGCFKFTQFTIPHQNGVKGKLQKAYGSMCKKGL